MKRILLFVIILTLIPSVAKASDLQDANEVYKDDIELLEETVNEYLDSYRKHTDESYQDALSHIEILNVYDIKEYSDDNTFIELSEAVAFQYIHTFNEYDEDNGIFNEEYEIGDKLNYIGFFYTGKNITDETLNIAYSFTSANINSDFFTNHFRYITLMEHRFEIEPEEEFTTLAIYPLDQLEFEDVEALKIYFPLMSDLEWNDIEEEEEYMIEFSVETEGWCD